MTAKGVAGPRRASLAQVSQRLRPLVLCCLVPLAILSPWLGIPRLSMTLMITICIYVIAASGLNLMFGYAGMLSLGGAVFMGMGAYAYALASQVGHWPIGVALVSSVLITVASAVVVGTVLVRLPGYYFAVATLGLALAFYSLLFALPGAGGGSGLIAVPIVHAGPVVISDDTQWYVVAVVITVVMLLFLSWLVAGKRGRVLRLVRQDELAAEVLGVPVFRTKLLVFALGGLFGGVAGALLFLSSGLINPDSVGVLTSVQLTILVVIGGPGYRMGPVIGAFTVLWLQALLNDSGQYELVTYGAVLLAVVFYLRHGIEGAFAAGWRMIVASGPTRPSLVQRLLPGRRDLDREEAAEPFSGGPRVLLDRGLEVRGARRRFGGLLAVNDVSIALKPGQVTALIGANGAGKSTLLNLISGVEPLNHGSILLDGDEIGSLTPAQRSRRGLVRTFQVPRLIDELSVIENIVVGHEASERPLLRRNPAGERARLTSAAAVISELGLGDLAQRRAASLGTGERKSVELARAVLAGARVILLDEPAVGLSAAEVARLREWLQRMRDTGVAILVVDHNMDFIRDLADHVCTMEAGAIVWQGPPSELQAPRALRQRSALPEVPARSSNPGAP